MDSLELNKAAAAVLLAGIAFVGSGLVGKALVHPEIPDKLAINIAVPEEAAGGATGSAAAGVGTGSAAPDPPIGVLMASADPAKGESLVKAQGCVACHTFNKGGAAG